LLLLLRFQYHVSFLAQPPPNSNPPSPNETNKNQKQTGLDPVDVLLLLAAAENDDPKIEELLAAGANAGVRDNKGRVPRELATKPAVLKMLEEAEAKFVSKA
jgi:hypothetical protein